MSSLDYFTLDFYLREKYTFTLFNVLIFCLYYFQSNIILLNSCSNPMTLIVGPIRRPGAVGYWGNIGAPRPKAIP